MDTKATRKGSCYVGTGRPYVEFFFFGPRQGFYMINDQGAKHGQGPCHQGGAIVLQRRGTTASPPTLETTFSLHQNIDLPSETYFGVMENLERNPMEMWNMRQED